MAFSNNTFTKRQLKREINVDFMLEPTLMGNVKA